MKRPLAGCLLCLLIASAALAELRITGDGKIAEGKLARLTAEGAADGSALIWDFDEERLDAEESGKRLLLVGPKGTYRIKCRAVSLKDGKTTVETARATLVIGEGDAPKPKPKPDEPTSTPFPAKSLRCLILYESADLSKLTAKQQVIIFGKAVRDYLEAKCDPGPDGKEREYAIWDKDFDPRPYGRAWVDVMARKRGSVPWIVVGNDKGGYEGPLPADVDATLALLKKYGG